MVYVPLVLGTEKESQTHLRTSVSSHEPNLWVRHYGQIWEILCIYVDDLLAILVLQKVFFDTLVGKYKDQLKDVEEIKYQLSGNYFCDPSGTLCWGAQKYIKRFLENYEREHGGLPKKFCPLSVLMKDHKWLVACW